MRIAGYADVNEGNLKRVQAALSKYSGKEYPFTRTLSAQSPARGPSVNPLKVANWYGGRGGHMGFSPVVPAVGRTVVLPAVPRPLVPPLALPAKFWVLPCWGGGLDASALQARVASE